MDEELFELCKEVYKRTGWLKYNTEHDADFYYATNDLEFKDENYEVVSREHYHFPQGFIAQDFIPVYTSDYLLEKLHRTDADGYHIGILVGKGKNGDKAVSASAQATGWLIQEAGDTLLVALLKLTIALSEAGELNNE